MHITHNTGSSYTQHQYTVTEPHNQHSDTQLLIAKEILTLKTSRTFPISASSRDNVLADPSSEPPHGGLSGVLGLETLKAFSHHPPSKLYRAHPSHKTISYWVKLNDALSGWSAGLGDPGSGSSLMITNLAFLTYMHNDARLILNGWMQLMSFT
ncbi:hypothetical protein E2C01_020923 [Portunus trituberculatus]|uniref:Uncharacterized protein n=1 Tax=Portunus trituberculatus TaxID=210409 RepID=A0A5B7E4Q8_PORTR|nr:hypothetical protein [Portunus trituberculatus]